MSQRRKNVNLDNMFRRYHQATRKEKSKLLDELCDLGGYNRKYLLQFFNTLTGKKYLKRGRKTEGLLETLRRIWLATDQMCSKRLKVAIPIVI